MRIRIPIPLRHLSCMELEINIKEFSLYRTHPAYSVVFLLSGGGKLNYAGTKRWLEEHLDLGKLHLLHVIANHKIMCTFFLSITFFMMFNCGLKYNQAHPLNLTFL
mgnify:CR=1 FL=1